MNCLHRTLSRQVHSNTLHFKVHTCTLDMSLHVHCATEESGPVDNSTKDGVAEEDGYEISGTVRQPKLAATRVLGESTAKHTVTSSVILLHNPTFNASTAIS